MEQNAKQELYAQEEQCDRAVKTLIRSLGMRVVVSALLIFAIFWRMKQTLFLAALVGFVMLVNLLGAVPLARELKKQLQRRKELRAQEEE